MLLKIVFVSLVLGIAFSNGAPSCCVKLRVAPAKTSASAKYQLEFVKV